MVTYTTYKTYHYLCKNYMREHRSKKKDWKIYVSAEQGFMKGNSGQGCSNFGLTNDHQRRSYNNWMAFNTRRVYFVQKPWKIYVSASEYVFYVSANVWLLLGVFQCFLRNVWLLVKDIKERLLLERKCAAYSFTICWRLCGGCFRDYFMIFNERVAPFERKCAS